MISSVLLSQLAALAQVMVIDLVLAGDNAVVIGMAVAGLPPAQKRRAVLIGVSFAVIVRVAMAFMALRLLAIVGLFAGRCIGSCGGGRSRGRPAPRP
jgi:predicted tellurium resistance membrane protein TerC